MDIRSEKVKNVSLAAAKHSSFQLIIFHSNRRLEESITASFSDTVRGRNVVLVHLVPYAGYFLPTIFPQCMYAPPHLARSVHSPSTLAQGRKMKTIEELAPWSILSARGLTRGRPAEARRAGASSARLVQRTLSGRSAGRPAKYR